MNVQTNQRIDTMESSLNQKLDGLQSDLDHNIDILQYSISRLTNQQHVHPEEENPKEERLIDTIVEEHCKHQLQEELIETFVEFFEGLSESSYICTALCPSRKNEAISPLMTKEGCDAPFPGGPVDHRQPAKTCVSHIMRPIHE